MPKRRDIGGKSGDARLIISTQLWNRLPTMAIVFFLDLALAPQGVFPLAFQRRRHEATRRIDRLVAPLGQLNVVTSALELLLPMLVESAPWLARDNE